MTPETLALILQIIGILFLIMGLLWGLKDLVANEKGETAKQVARKVRSQTGPEANVASLQAEAESEAKDKSNLELLADLIKAIASLPRSVFFTLAGLILIFGDTQLANLLIKST